MKTKRTLRSRKGGVIVDFGNVIIDHTNTTEDFVLNGDYNTIPPVTGAFESLKRLNKRFGGNVTVVYKATDVADEKILSWLAHHQFVKHTGIPLYRVRRTLQGRDKTPHIEQTTPTHHGTTVVIDDRLEVMTYFNGLVDSLFLFNPRQDEIEKFRKTGAATRVRIVRTWDELMKSIMETIK